MARLRRRHSPYLFVPNNLGRLRQGLEKTQAEVAAALEVSRGTYASWESGMTLPSAAYRQRMETYFGSADLYLVVVRDFLDRMDGLR